MVGVMLAARCSRISQFQHGGGNLGKVPRQRKQKCNDKRASIARQIPARNMPVQDLIAKAGTLLEALPYIQKFSGATFVVKYGGSSWTRRTPVSATVSPATSFS